jgi:RNA polymerase sigma-70 factor (family 1)
VLFRLLGQTLTRPLVIDRFWQSAAGLLFLLCQRIVNLGFLNGWMSNYSEYSDQELAVFFRAGDAAAFTQIYKRYWKKIYLVAASRLGELEAEEIVQIIFLNLWTKRQRFELARPFSHYFAVAAKYEVISAMRKDGSAAAYKRELKYSFSESSEDTLHDLDYSELQQKLAILVEELPEKCKLVFKLKYEQGLTQKQIAGRLLVSEKTVEAHLSRARRAIKGNFGLLYCVVFSGFFH